MVIILGVVFVIMVVMNGALFYALCSAVAATEKQVNACFVRELEDYNSYLEQKEEESRQLYKEKEALQEEIQSMESVIYSLRTSPFYAPKPAVSDAFVPLARHVDKDFFVDHKMVSDAMKEIIPERIVPQICGRHTYAGDLEKYDALCRLQELLTVNTVYELCTVPVEQQLQVLREVLTGVEVEILEQYLSNLEDGQEFDVLKFEIYINELHAALDPKMYIRTGENSTYGDIEDIDVSQELVHQYDDNISDGFNIVYQNQFFDFSFYRLRSRK